MSALDPALDRLRAAAGRIAATRTEVERGGRRAPRGAAQGADEASWAPTEVLAHVCEMLPYWLGEMERVLAPGDAGPAAFGRTAADQIRTLTVARDATLPPRELYDRMAAGIDRYERRLPQLSEADVRRRGTHPTRGELTVEELLERFVVGHLEEHAVQLEDALRAS